ncbi:MAG: putative metal-binding motif-containing protein [Myxococcota bacterium]|nr:putative metal-binding motif-containing protein [Myxococcota bacterium]
MVLGGNDCDDTRAYRYPGADERCNGLYDDCNSLFVHGGFPSDEVDNDFDCFVECGGFDPVEWEGGVHSCSYRDLNGVVQAETTVIGGEDCNDTVEYTYVGAAPQTDPDACLTDFDGDGLSDRSWNLCPVAQTFEDARFRIEGTNNQNVSVLARGIGNFDGDGVADILISSGQGLFENKYHRLFPGTLLNDAAPVLTENDYLWSEESYVADWSNRFPYAVIDDIDGDGLSEYAYGYSFGGYEFTGLYRPGYVALYLSTNFANPGNGSTAANQDLEWAGPNSSAGLSRVYGVGDLDKDGLGEFMMIAGGATENFLTVGKAYLYYGSTLNTLSGLVDLSTADKVFTGTPSLIVSHALNLDVDGDSVKDVVVVYSGYYLSSSYENFVAIYLGASLATKPRVLSHLDADLAIHGTSEDTLVGRIIGNAGDVDGDGTDDLILSEHPNIYHLPNYNLVLSANLDPSNPYQSLGDVTSLIFEGHDDDEWTYNNTNYSFVKTLGDLDGDGLSDIGFNWYASDADAQWNTSIFLGSSIQSLLNAQNDTGLDTGQNAQPTTLQFTEGDFHFEDVQSGLAGGDFDQDGLGEIVLSNYTDNYSVLGGGVIGVFSPCEY